MRRTADLAFVLFLASLPVAIAVGCANGGTFKPYTGGDGANGGNGGSSGDGGAGAKSNYTGGQGGVPTTTSSGFPDTGPGTTSVTSTSVTSTSVTTTSVTSSTSVTTTSVTSTTATTSVSTTAVTSTGAGGPSSACDSGTCQSCADCADNDFNLCGFEYFDCIFDDYCSGLADCLSTCAAGDQTCVDNCAAAYPDGIQLYNDWAGCVVCNACYQSCDGANSGC